MMVLFILGSQLNEGMKAIGVKQLATAMRYPVGCGSATMLG
jgi:hypothetical protein